MSTNPKLAKDANQIRDDPVVTDLVSRARNGDKTAWDALVERYAPLIWSICARHQLGGAQAGDAGRSVWLQLADHLDTIPDPAALAGWLAATTRRECGRVARAAQAPRAAGSMPSAQTIPDEQARTVEHELLAAERHAALRDAFLHLPLSCQRLITMLIEDPRAPCAEISAKLDIPVAAIGPARSRCLDELRRHPAIAALIRAEAETARCDAGPGPVHPKC
jgi:RNA polymerase sigma factor (sigma-70 family)